MSATLLAALLSFAPPPPPSTSTSPEEGGEDDSGDDDSGDDDSGDDAPAEEEGGEDDSAKAKAKDAKRETPLGFEPPPPDVGKDLPKDERGDPVLEYGEAEDGDAIEFADEAEDGEELEFADEAPPPEDFDYDQSRQRPTPTDEALGRQADTEDDLGEPEFQGRQESPQRFAIEIKFGPYLPSVDRRWAGDGFGPYATIFGETNDRGETIAAPKQALFSAVGFEWQFYHLGGPFSLGTTVGFFRDSANALLANPDPDADSIRTSADRAQFNVVPITLLLGYRFELLADRFKVPLVPYARGGVGYGIWWATKGGRGQTTTNSEGQKSRGGSFGWQVNLGLMIRLDFIDKASAVDLDRSTGINHTYIFGEWQFSHLDGFGSDKAMPVGDDTFTVGLAVAF